MSRNVPVIAVLLSILALAACAGAPGAAPDRRPDARCIARAADAAFAIPATWRVIRNLEDMTAWTTTADGYLRAVMDKLQRLRELAVQGANGIYSPADRRRMIGGEGASIVDELRRIVGHAAFNGRPVLAGDDPAWFATLDADRSAESFALDGRALCAALRALAVDDVSPVGCAALLGAVDAALRDASFLRAAVGAYAKRFAAAGAWQQVRRESYEDARNRRQDVSFTERAKAHLRVLGWQAHLLAVQAANGVYSREDRAQLNLDWRQRLAELRRIVEATGLPSVADGADDDALLDIPRANRELVRLAAALRALG